MNARARRIVWVGVGVGLTAAAIAGGLASRAAAPSTAAASPRLTPFLDGEVIRYSPEFARSQGLHLVAAEERELTPRLSVTGQLTYDERRVTAIGARIAGRLRVVNKVVGDAVKAGEVVAELESVELGRAQAEVLKARAHEEVALADETRERHLAEAKISAVRDAEHATAQARAATAERSATEKAVEALGGTMGGETGIVRLRSPISGALVESHARRGETVEPSETLFLVADLSNVWAELTIYERELSAVRLGDSVEIRVPSAHETVTGKVSMVSAVLDAQKRSGTLRVELENSAGLLRPGVSVVGHIAASGPRKRFLVIPKDAVTLVDGKPTVFVAQAAGTVEPRELVLGAEDETSVAVERGLRAGEQVATGAVLALKSEVFR